jgi:uncharacterized protein (TIGR00369 family)
MTTILERARAMIAGNLPEPGVTKLIGARLIAIDSGSARVIIETDERHANPMGTVHGGILCDIADAAMGMAYASALEDGESFTTLELKINFLRPVRRSVLQADGLVVQRGRTVGLTECTITDEKGRLIAKATSTCLTLRGEQAAGR